MHRLYGPAIDRPLRVLLTFGLLLALSLPGLFRLRLLTDGRALAPAASPEAFEDRSIRAEFGVRDLLVAVVRSSDTSGVFNARTLEHVAALTRDLQAIPGVRPEDVTSLATEPGDHVHTGSFDFKAWLDPLPKTPEEVRDLERRLLRATIYRGTLISSDTPPSATAILLGVEDGADRGALARAVRGAVAAHATEGDQVLLAGAPLAESQLGLHLLQDLALLVPIAFAVMGAILFLSLRNAWLVVLPLAGVAACLLATFGLMGWCGAPVYLTCLVMPVFLTAVGVAESVHICDQVLHRLRGGDAGDPRGALRATMDELARPMTNSAVTTAIGFLSFAVSPIDPVRVFGLFMAAGVMLSLLLSLTVFPACLALLGPRVGSGARTGSSLRERTAPLFAAWTRGVLARRRTVLFASVVLAAAAALGASRVRIQDSWIEGFSPGSELRRDTAVVDELFGGTHLLRLRLRGDTAKASAHVDLGDLDHSSLLLSPAQLGPGGGGPPGGFVGDRVVLKPVNVPTVIQAWPVEVRVTDARAEAGGTRLFLTSPLIPESSLLDLLPQGTVEFDCEIDSKNRLIEPSMLEVLRAFEEHLAAQRPLGVGAVLGPWTHLSNLSAMLGADPEKARAILAQRKGVARTLDLYRRNRGERRTREVFSADFDRGLVTLLLGNASYTRVSELMRDLRAWEREHLAPNGVRVDLGGDLALSQATVGGIVETQLGSLALSLLGIVLVTALLSRSIWIGLCCAVPCAGAVISTFGLMGVLGIPLGVATGMFAGITIGVGDDFAIHLWERLRGRLGRGEAVEGAIVASMADVGPAILVDALTVGAGFSVLVLSRVPTDARLGALLVFSIAGCLAATLTLLPPLLRLRARRVAGGG